MKVVKPYVVKRRNLDENSWYEVMLSPFTTFEQCIEYIQKYKVYYPPEYQNYSITFLQ